MKILGIDPAARCGWAHSSGVCGVWELVEKTDRHPGTRLERLRAPDIAINHDANAIAMHESNHPSTKHVREDVWKTDLKKLVGRRKVGLLWLSPRWQLQRFPVNSGNLVVVTHVAAAIVKANCLAELEV